jgi:hypothetical protein
MLSEAMRFFGEVLPSDRAFIVKPKDPDSMSVKELKIAIRNAGLAERAAGFCEKQEFVALLKEHYSKLT